LLLNFKKDFGSKIKTNLMLGQNMFQSYYRGLSGTANDLNIPEFYQLSNTTSQVTSAGTSKYRTAALFGELALQYADMLFLSATGRNDWSTTMPKNNLSEFYPSFRIHRTAIPERQ
jgi:hypothetical protein